jgi:hypothetical protein
MRCWVCCGLAVVVIAFLFTFSPIHNILFPDKEGVIPFDFTDSREAPLELFLPKDNRYHYGRWLSPIPQPNLHSLNLFQRCLQKKEWEFIALSTERYLFGLAVGQLNYAGTGFIYFYDSVTGQTLQHASLLPLGLKTHFSNSSMDGCSSFAFRSLSVSFCQQTEKGATEIDINASVVFSDSTSINIKAQLGSLQKPSGTLALSFPIGPKRSAYTHKSSGMQVNGNAEMTSSQGVKTIIPLQHGAGLLDWTRSMHARLTLWFWVALSWLTPNGDRVGINLSHGVYPHPTANKTATKQIGMENGIWWNDKVYLIHSPLIVQGEPGHGDVSIGKTWRCYTEDHTLDLTFTPADLVPSSVHLYVIHADLLHHFGRYSGRVKVAGQTLELVNVPGILEDHFAWW